MDYQYVDGRLQIRRTEEEKKPILQRLKRIEGQVRGLQAMVQEDRYCLDEVQQMNAITAAVREAVLQLISTISMPPSTTRYTPRIRTGPSRRWCGSCAPPSGRPKGPDPRCPVALAAAEPGLS